MNFERLVATSLPFVFAASIKVALPGVRAYAKRSVAILTPAPPANSPIAVRGVELAVYVYRQVSFVLSLLIACVATFAIGVASAAPVVNAVGAVIMLSVLPTWILYWQGLTAVQLEGTEGKWMSAWGWATLGIQWAVTVWAVSALP